MTTVSVWSGSISGETARTQGFTQKWEAHLFPCFTVSHDHWVLPALPLVAHYTKKVRPGGFRETAVSAQRAWVIFKKVSWGTKLDFFFFCPVLTAILKCQGNGLRGPLYDCVRDLEDGKLKGSCDTASSLGWAIWPSLCRESGCALLQLVQRALQGAVRNTESLSLPTQEGLPLWGRGHYLSRHFVD